MKSANRAHLGEKVVSENEYLSAMVTRPDGEGKVWNMKEMLCLNAPEQLRVVQAKRELLSTGEFLPFSLKS